MQSFGSNPHVLRMVGWSMLNEAPIILLEYCAKGNLREYLRESALTLQGYAPNVTEDHEGKPCLDLRDLLSYAWQVCDGMLFLSSKGFIHRDLAARNVLLTAKSVAKISDFGLCWFSNEEVYANQQEIKLPIKWMAPECLEKAQFGIHSDV
ncbi:Protein F09A5.2 [Aphelenchoides avenae]|nr:Protein F09A5.2 [Aphelenchus avenae]